MTNAMKLEAARAKILAAETANRSESTMRKLWKQFFALEDAAKLAGGWR